MAIVGVYESAEAVSLSSYIVCHCGTCGKLFCVFGRFGPDVAGHVELYSPDYCPMCGATFDGASYIDESESASPGQIEEEMRRIEERVEALEASIVFREPRGFMGWLWRALS